MNLRRGPRLQVRRPSPTTVEFTVTTAPPASASVARRALVLATVAARAGLALAALLLLLLCSTSAPRRRQHVGARGRVRPLPPPLPRLHLVVAAAAAVDGAAAAAVLLAPACVAALLLWAAVARVHASESLLVLRGLGVQTASAGATHLSAPRTRFIPTPRSATCSSTRPSAASRCATTSWSSSTARDDVVVVFPHPAAPRHVVETSGGASAAVCSRGDGGARAKG